jgi:hypothetical protein
VLDHFYQKIPGFFSFQPVYDLALARIPDHGVWVEIGAWQGRSISYAVIQSLTMNKNIQFHVVDIWRLAEKHHRPGLESDHDLYEAFLRNTASIQDQFVIHRKSRDVAAADFEDQSLDFVMIDADHSYEAVARDIRAWWPKMRPGALMVGDDLRGSFPGVRQAITEFAAEQALPWSKQNGCWLMECPC